MMEKVVFSALKLVLVTLAMGFLQKCAAGGTFDYRDLLRALSSACFCGVV
jgi:hypothetical protein